MAVFASSLDHLRGFGSQMMSNETGPCLHCSHTQGYQGGFDLHIVIISVC